VRVAAIGDFNATEELVSVYQFRLLGGGTVPDDVSITDMVTVLTAVITILKALSTVLTVWRRVTAFNVTTQTLIGEGTFGAGIAGTAAGEPGAPGVCAVTSFKTSIPRVILRKFSFPVDEGFIGGTGLLTVPAVAIMANYSIALLADHVVDFRTYEYGYLSPKALGWVAPNNAVTTNIPAYQRRRRQGVGS
jgi:hypothetical protein